MNEANEQNDKGPKDKGEEPTWLFDDSVVKPGGQIGPFRIERELGRGGAGVVYLARDTRLNRSVAIKSLPVELMENPMARTRFAREAQVLASLNHPNIATIYEEFQETEDVGYLILEYVPGQTLAERITGAKLKPQEALSIAQQIAEAVAAAHENDVIHRDLKPGNIKITPEGRIKVLDFGLAKAIGGQVIDQRSTTTELGRVIGTPAYMSPEQARGQETDKRCDIWSFGCVLYEMLTGKIPFEGGTFSDTLVAILDREPDWNALPQATPVNIRILLRRCLEKDLKRRLHDIADAVIEINETLSGTLELYALPGKVAEVSRLFRRDVVIAALACSIAGVIIAGAIFMCFVMPNPPEPPSVLGLPLNTPAELYSGASPNCFVAISPDSTRIVYVGESDDGDPQLYMCSQGDHQFKPIPGTKNSHNPFFSPDGLWIGFFTIENQLKKVSVDGGEPQPLLENVPDGRFWFGSWADDETIVFSAYSVNSSIQQVPDTGAQQAEILVPAAPNDVYYCYPQVLPKGNAILYSLVDPNGSCIWAYLPTTDKSQLVLKNASYARYVKSGHLIFVQDNVLLVAPFDLEQLKPGRGVRLVNYDVEFDNNKQTPQIAISDNGTIVYITGAELSKRELVWVDRQGKTRPLNVDADLFEQPCLSPDGRRIAVGVRSQEERDIRVSIYDIESKRSVFLTMANGGYPQWSPEDEKLIAYWGRAPGFKDNGIFCKGVDTGADPRRLAGAPPTGTYLHPYSWSKHLLACTAWNPNTKDDIWLVDTDGNQEPKSILDSNEREYDPAFSPDGQWLAYVLEKSDQPQIFLWEYPAGEKLPVSTGRATNPVWSRDGRELYYISDDSMMVAKVTPEADLPIPIGKPEQLFPLPDEIESRGRGLVRTYDVSNDGKFLMLKQSGGTEGQLIYVQNWFEELKRLAPPTKNK
ncbi:MAG: protein kinase domain-containing protein [Planctomycetota bacterium]|jgi:serine/threonine-protein kinase